MARDGLNSGRLFARQPFSERIDYHKDPVAALGGLRLDFPYAETGAWVDGALDLSTDLNLDLARAFRKPRPKKPLLSLGPFYLDASNATVQLLLSDNADQTPSNRKGGAIGIVDVQGIQGGAQIGNFSLSLIGDLILLPFEGKMGLDGFELDEDIYDLTVESRLGGADTTDLGVRTWGTGTVDFGARAAYELNWGDWDFVLADVISYGDYQKEIDYDQQFLENVLWDSLDRPFEDSLTLYYAGYTFENEDRLGSGQAGYSFGGESGTQGRARNQKDGFQRDRGDRRQRDRQTEYEDDDDNDEERDFTLNNTISLTATDPESYPFQPIIRYQRSNDWYWYANPDQQEDKPSWDEDITVIFRSVREDSRFPPYLAYTASHDSDEVSYDHVFRTGIAGPLSEYTMFNGNIGLGWEAEEGEREWLYQVNLTNRPRRTTQQSLSVGRFYTEEDEELQTDLIYTLSQKLGPYLTGSLVANWTRTLTRPPNSTDTNEEDLGLGCGIKFRSPTGKLSIRLRGLLEQNREDLNDAEEGDNWRVIFNTYYSILDLASDRVYLQYRYEWEDDRQLHDVDWESRFDLNYLHTFQRKMLSSDFSLRYRLRWQESSDKEDEYWENLVLLTWNFPLK